MKNPITAFLLVAVFFTACVNINKNPDDESISAQPVEEVRDGMFIHLSHGEDDPHRCLMALNMAVIMAEDKDVLVYLDIKAVELVTKNAPDVTHPAFPSSLEQIKKLIDSGVEIQACPGCMKAAGITENDLMEGVSVANKEKFFNFTSGDILSLDY
jgi:predicted peroxiredoxin